ncbi:MAG: deazaflavin-dependent oxidoreductase (nitroreductase family) [Candidatus Aldehydirespiratoraceae bacterium]|jgi:deazaflavin-dependent oxidoreductase (nitroreductase family)
MRQSGEMTDRDWVGFNAGIIEEFRANDGKVAAFGDLPVIVLHTIGALTGAVRLTPLIPVFDGDRMYIFGTAEGASKDPAWAGNLRTHPRITIETATASFVADVLALPEVDARRMVDERAATTPKLREYVASAAPRTIPVFSITPIK